MPEFVAATSSGTHATDLSSLTWAHPVEGDNRVLYVMVSTPFGTTVSGVTFADAPMTKIFERGGFLTKLQIWRLFAPTVGTYNIVVTLGASASIAAVARSYSDVHQSIDGPISVATGNALLATSTVASASGSLVVSALGVEDDDAVEASGTSISPAISFSTATQDMVCASSHREGAPETTAEWTIPGRDIWILAVMPLLFPAIPAGVTTEEYWDVDGVPLNTMAYNIETIEGREGIPPKRGENIAIGTHRGRQWVQKPPDQRPLTLGMWVVGSDNKRERFDGSRARFKANFAFLKRLFGVTDRLLTITRRERRPDGVLVLQADAEVVGTMDLSARGPAAGKFSVDLIMPDPYWYGPAVTDVSSAVSPASGVVFPIVFPVVFGTPGNPGTVTVENKGDVDALPLIRLHGPLENWDVILIGSGKRLSFSGPLAEGEFLEVDTSARTVKLGGTSSRYGWLSLDSEWFTLPPGRNTLRVTTQTGTGRMEVSFRPPYN